MTLESIKLYKDVDLRLIPHPLSGDIQTLVNDDAIKQSLRNIMMTRKWDIPFEPEHGNIRSMLFDQPDPIHISDMRSRIEWLIRSMEPRVKVNDIKIKLTPDESAYHVSLFYTVRSLYKDDTLDYFFQRIR